MAVSSDTTTGTITLTSGSINFTTTGVNMLTRGHLPGDTIYRNGLVLIIKTITADNVGTLLDPCPAGAAGTDVPVRIRYQPDGSRVAAMARDLIETLGDGTLQSLAEIDGTNSGMLPVFGGPNALIARTFAQFLGDLGMSSYFTSLIDAADASALQTDLGITPFIKTLLDDPDALSALYTIGAVRNGGGSFMDGNKILMGYDGPAGRIRAQVDTTVFGFFATGDFTTVATKSGNGWMRNENGVIVQWGRTNGGGDSTISFPTVFPNQCSSMIVCFDQASENASEIQSVNVSAKSNGGFTWRGRYLLSGGNVAMATQPVMFIAIGF